MALLVSYLINNPGELSLDKWLDEQVFGGSTGIEITPTPEEVEGFNRYTANYVACLPVEDAACKAKK